MNPLQVIHERYVALFGDHATAAVRGNEEQPTTTQEFSRAAPRSQPEVRP
jgi:hypothetical protein